MRRIGWIIGGYLLAVTMVAAMMFSVLALFGPSTTGVGEKLAFLGKLFGAGVVAFAPIYLGVRAILLLFSLRSAFAFALAFIAPCIVVFAGLAQVPDMWLIDWISHSGDMSELVVEEELARQLWGGYYFGPLFYTGLGVTFWCLSGACFGVVIWWSEGRAFGTNGAGETN